MTQQEFVKKESKKHRNSTIDKMGLQEYSFSDGLTKGLEISAEIIQEITGCNKERAKELLEVFLTEKYGQ